MPPQKQPTLSSRSCMVRACYFVDTRPTSGPCKAALWRAFLLQTPPPPPSLFFFFSSPDARRAAGVHTQAALAEGSTGLPVERMCPPSRMRARRSRTRARALRNQTSSPASPCRARAAAWKSSPGQRGHFVALLPSGCAGAVVDRGDDRRRPRAARTPSPGPAAATPAPSPTTTPERPGPAVSPSSVLVLPFLPWLADASPAGFTAPRPAASRFLV